MTLQSAISLITHPAIAAQKKATWADLGCGSGLFTYALANLLQRGSSICAVDKSALPMHERNNPNNIDIYRTKLDFIKDLLPFQNMDGILMANSLHYVADKIRFIYITERHLAHDGIFLIVEYDTIRPNKWVPYPVSNKALKKIFSKAGYSNYQKLGELPSLFNAGKMYAAMITK